MQQETIRDSIFWVELERIKPNPYQPRREFDQLRLQELADSIRMYGLLQPLTVTRREIPLADGGLRVEYELIAGERRLRASKLAGLAQVPVIIRSGEESDLLKLELAIIENLQREDLNPVDRARAFSRLNKEFNFSLTEIGRKLGRSREYVSNTVRLLQLPEYVQQYLAEGKISEGHTRPLLMLVERPDEQKTLTEEIVLKKLTVREAEAVARRVAQDRVSARYKINPELLALERQLTEHFGTRVQIEPRPVGGRVVISYFSPEDLDTVLTALKLEAEAQLGNAIFGGDPDSAVLAEGEGSTPDSPVSTEEGMSFVPAALEDAVPLTLSAREGDTASPSAMEAIEERYAVSEPTEEVTPRFLNEEQGLGYDSSAVADEGAGTPPEDEQAAQENAASPLASLIQEDLARSAIETSNQAGTPQELLRGLMQNLVHEPRDAEEVSPAAPVTEGVVPGDRPLPEQAPDEEESDGLTVHERSALLDDRSRDERDDEDLYAVRNFNI